LQLTDKTTQGIPLDAYEKIEQNRQRIFKEYWNWPTSIQTWRIFIGKILEKLSFEVNEANESIMLKCGIVALTERS